MDEKKRANQYNIEIKKLSDLPKDDFVKPTEEDDLVVASSEEELQVSF